MIVPRLHVITNDAVLTAPGFLDTAARLLGLGRSRIALHVRGHRTDAVERYRLASALVAMNAGGATLLVNDRIDVALAAGVSGVQLGRRSVSVRMALPLCRPIGAVPLSLGYSAHDPDEAATAARDGADFVIAGTIFASATHPGAAVTGPRLLTETARRTRSPVIAIGGLSQEGIAVAIAAGASGVALLGAIWHAADPAVALEGCLETLEGIVPEPGTA